jgi:hypothetical protein
VCKKSPNGVLPFLEEQCILLMSAKPRNHLPSWQSDNFCQDARKMLHCSTKNLTRRFVQLAVKKSWLPSLLASLRG